MIKYKVGGPGGRRTAFGPWAGPCGDQTPLLSRLVTCSPLCDAIFAGNGRPDINTASTDNCLGRPWLRRNGLNQSFEARRTTLLPRRCLFCKRWCNGTLWGQRHGGVSIINGFWLLEILSVVEKSSRTFWKIVSLFYYTNMDSFEQFV